MMRNVFIFLGGMAVSVMVVFAMGSQGQTERERYQLLAARVMRAAADSNRAVEEPVCFKVDTWTGQCEIFEQCRVKAKNGCSVVNYWSPVVSSEAYSNMAADSNLKKAGE